MHKTDFIQAINLSFGSGGMFCTLSDVELGNYLLNKVMEFMNTSDPRILTAVENIGQQDGDPPVFVLSTQVSPKQQKIMYKLVKYQLAIFSICKLIN